MVKRKVSFFAGLNTPSKLDDRKVEFFAEVKGNKQIKAPRGMFGGIKTPKFKFDKTFGLGEPNLFKNKVGIDTNFGRGTVFDQVDALNNEFVNADFVNQPSAIDPIEEEPLIDVEMEEQFQDEINGQVPTLLDSIPKINQGKRIPLTDEEIAKKEKIKRQREEIPNSGFENVRFKQLSSGGAALTPSEERNFEQGRGFRGQR